MSSPGFGRFGSVRVRVTAVATLATAAAVTVAAVGLVWTVERALVDGIRDQARARVGDAVDLIEEGVPPDVVAVDAPSPFDVLEIVDAEGNVIGTSWAAVAGHTLTGPLRGQVPPTGTAGVFTASISPGQLDGSEVYDVAFEAVDSTAGPVTVLAGLPLRDVERSVDALTRALALGLPGLVALVALISWFVAGRALRPVDAIRAEVEAISASTIHRRVPEPSTGDEVSRLAHTMNAMLDRLEASSVRQRQFVSDASHELRSPVAAIRTELEVATMARTRPDWPAVAATVLAEEARLEALVGDLLLLASVDEQATGASWARLDLGDLARKEAARSRAVPVEVRTDAAVSVQGRADQLVRVVANLLDNATRHARGTVRLTITRRDHTGRLVVDDDGPGIPAQDRERVFERFARMEAGRARSAGGAGLGLALVRAIVERHRGRVWVDDAPTGGARLVVELPSAVPPRTGGD